VKDDIDLLYADVCKKGKEFLEKQNDKFTERRDSIKGR
jgi:hypothetical protein